MVQLLLVLTNYEHPSRPVILSVLTHLLLISLKPCSKPSSSSYFSSSFKPFQALPFIENPPTFFPSKSHLSSHITYRVTCNLSKSESVFSNHATNKQTPKRNVGVHAYALNCLEDFGSQMDQLKCHLHMFCDVK